MLIKIHTYISLNRPTLHVLERGERREFQDLDGKLPLCASSHCTPRAESPGQHRGLGPSSLLPRQPTPRLGLEAVHTLSQHLVVAAGKVGKMNRERFLLLGTCLLHIVLSSFGEFYFLYRS